MQFLAFLSEWIELRSFASIWYWIAVAVFWAILSHRILGVPMVMVDRALWGDGHAEADAATIARLHAKTTARPIEVFTLFFIAFALASCLTLGFLLKVEIFKAISLIFLPWCYLQFRAHCAALFVLQASDRDITRRLARERRWIRILSLVFTLVSALYGVGHILNHSVLN